MSTINQYLFVQAPYFDNDNDAFVPEVWAQEALMILEENMLMTNLVHRDFENEIAVAGDVVNTRRPSTFSATRKTDSDSVVDQDATATNVPVVLDQHIYTTFIIRDGEMSRAFQNLVEIYLAPAALSIAQACDQVVMGQIYHFLGNNAGKLGTDATKSTLTDLKEVQNTALCPPTGRNLVIPPSIENDLLNVLEFTAADRIGDDGTAIREGSLGRKMGYDIFMSQHAPAINGSNSDTRTAAINVSGGLAAGSTVLTVDGTSNWPAVAGEWLTVAGDMIPQFITAVSGSSNQTITITPGLKRSVLDNATVTVYDGGTVNYTAGYTGASISSGVYGWAKPITVDGFTNAAQKGQLISFGNSTATKQIHAAINTPTTTSILLDRPLQADRSNNDVVGVGPAGNYGFAFHRNALGFITRPLAQPMGGTGVQSAVVNYNGLGIRVTVTYDGVAQGHRVTLDLLAGVKVFDTNLGAVLFA